MNHHLEPTPGPAQPTPAATPSTARTGVRPGTRLRRCAAAVAAAGVCLIATPVAASAAPTAHPTPASAAPAATATVTPTGAVREAGDSGLIDPDRLESVQASIVGLVIVWEEPTATTWAATEPLTVSPADSPVIAICTGWFDTPSTIATAGHCVDPKVGRAELDWQHQTYDPDTGTFTPPPAGRPDPVATVWAFQPHESGGVLDTPVKVHVEDYRSVGDGDTAALSVAGMPAGAPLAVAATDPRIGQNVTSIGYAGLNLMDTDGVDLSSLAIANSDVGQSIARMLQDSRLQPVNTSGTISSRQYRGGVPVYQVSADFDQGMSGGPTLNSDGEVVGLNSQMTIPFAAQNFNVVTDTARLRKFLHANTDTTSAISGSATGTGTGGGTGHDTPGSVDSTVDSTDPTTTAPAPAPAAAADPSAAHGASAPAVEDSGRPEFVGVLVSVLTGLAGIGLGWGIARRIRPANNTASNTASDTGSDTAGNAGNAGRDAGAAPASGQGDQRGRDRGRRRGRQGRGTRDVAAGDAGALTDESGR
ncbi:trypsin-like peptidase domain-containing protein [Pseudonocardia sp. CA-107938]|uniref:trypsin-like peptidase domain-containing protein n=1 Tax=Pseudonocardia sp. CA-107938 TaxID=3240021 RepID=UPI003D93FB09